MLDLESVRLFVIVAELRNLTRAAQIAGTVQPAVSQRLKALEGALGRRLLERTSRYVRLTAEGELFLTRARLLLAAHEDAVQFSKEPPVRIALGFDQHVVGPDIEILLRDIRAAIKGTSSVVLKIGTAPTLKACFDEGHIDAVVIRRETSGGDGELLGLDPLGWRYAEGLVLTPEEPVPLATSGAPCAVRTVAIRALEQAGRSWRDALIAPADTTLLAGARAGLGVAPLGACASVGEPDRGPELGLPALPSSEIVLIARSSTPAVNAGLRAISEGLIARLSAYGNPQVS